MLIIICFHNRDAEFYCVVRTESVNMIHVNWILKSALYWGDGMIRSWRKAVQLGWYCEPTEWVLPHKSEFKEKASISPTL
jgi:hypothetical protein